jgi:hypothetical protein
VIVTEKRRVGMAHRIGTGGGDMTKPCEIWVEQCEAARGIEDEFGTDKALSYTSRGQD